LRLVEHIATGVTVADLRLLRDRLFSGRCSPAFLTSAGVNIDNFLSRLGSRVIAKSALRIVPGCRTLREHLSQTPELPDQLAPTQEGPAGRGVIATHPEAQSEQDCQRQDDLGRVHRISLEQKTRIVAANITLEATPNLESSAHVSRTVDIKAYGGEAYGGEAYGGNGYDLFAEIGHTRIKHFHESQVNQSITAQLLRSSIRTKNECQRTQIQARTNLEQRKPL
jgi:hypothetical protein